MTLVPPGPVRRQGGVDQTYDLTRSPPVLLVGRRRRMEDVLDLKIWSVESVFREGEECTQGTKVNSLDKPNISRDPCSPQQ